MNITMWSSIIWIQIQKYLQKDEVLKIIIVWADEVWIKQGKHTHNSRYGWMMRKKNHMKNPDGFIKPFNSSWSSGILNTS
jgi:hypothetical protein